MVSIMCGGKWLVCVCLCFPPYRDKVNIEHCCIHFLHSLFIFSLTGDRVTCPSEGLHPEEANLLLNVDQATTIALSSD